MKKDNLMMSIIIINFIISALVLIYYFYILKYINKLKDNEICDKLNYPYLNIFYGIYNMIYQGAFSLHFHIQDNIKA